MTQSFDARRRVLLATAASAAAGLVPAAALAQSAWPGRPIKLIDVFAPGGSSDLVARATAAKLSPRIGQPIVVENRSGAGGSVGTDAVAKSAPDGHTLLLATTAMPINAVSGKKLPFDFAHDLIPIGLIASSPLLIVVPAHSPLQSLRDLVDQARARPDAIRYGSSGIGSLSHIGMELLAAQSRVQMLHVPYKGVALALNDLLAGQLQALLGSFSTFSPLLEAGKLRGLAVAGARRATFAPALPTAAEAGFAGFEIDYWLGLMGPARIPPDVVMRLNGELNASLAQDDMVQALAGISAVPRPGTPEEFSRLLVSERERWGQLIKNAGIQAE